MKLIRFATLSMLLLAVLLVSRPAAAQVDTGRLQGTVTDPQGAAVSGATVALTNTGTGLTQSVTTNDLGYYTLTALLPAHYRLEVTASGFKKVVREFDLQVAQVAVIDVPLSVGEVTQSLVVESGSPVVDAADSALGEVIVGRQVSELPLNGRNFTQLATLVPGVSRGIPTGSATGSQNNAETFRNGETGGASLVVNGLRPQNNNFILDGIDNNETLVNTIVFFPPADAIDEFRVQTSVAPAQFGRAGGALVVTSLKSGTNDWHGSAFWFNRNTNLQAKDFFNPKNSPTPAYNRNQFGGSLGGPILHNKWFVFMDYQGLRKRVPGSNDVATVPTDLMRKGDFSELLAGPGPANNPTGLPAPVQILDPTTGTQFMGNGAQPNVIPQARINPAGLAYLNAFPEPNCNASIDSRCHTIEQNYHNVRKVGENWNDFDVRSDYILNTTNSFFLRFSRGHADQTETPRLTTLPSGFGSGTNFNHPIGASVGWTDTINPSLVNEVRVGYVRTIYGFEPPFAGVDLCTQLGIVNCNTPLLGGIALIGGFNNQIEFTGDFGPFLVPQTSYNANETLSWTHGKHTFKFGGNVIRRDLNLYRPLAGKGFFNLSGNGNTPVTITGYEVSDLLAGFVNNYSHGPNFGTLGTRTWENGFFTQDDWRITPRLTFNLGLRYDVYTWPVEVQDRQSNFNLQTGAIELANQNGNSRAFIPTDFHDFGPRVGFAYQLTSDGKTVIRGGYGIFYFLDRGGISNQLGQNPPFGGENTVTFAQGFRVTLTGALSCQPNCTSAQLDATQATAALPSGNFTNLNLTNPSGVSMVVVLPTNVVPSVSQWNLQVQRQLGTNTSASLAYVGDRGKHLTRNYNFNEQQFGLPPNAINFPNLGSITVQDNAGNSIYNSLQAQVEHRFTRGFEFLGAFTWSKDIDDACGDLDSCAPQTYKNFAIERGLSNIDQDYRIVLSSLYELPFGRGKSWGTNWSRPVDWVIGGWQVNGIYTLQAGLPFSVIVDGAPQNVRADLIGTPSVNPGSLMHYINASAFALPPFVNGVYTRPGTAGRDILRGPGSSNLDFSLFKNFQLTERMRLEARGQAYNLTNTPHFANPNADLSQIATFGQITATQPFSYRQLELALRLTF
jgi:Carboxypeptidase regulatory-like domain